MAQDCQPRDEKKFKITRADRRNTTRVRANPKHVVHLLLNDQSQHDN